MSPELQTWSTAVAVEAALEGQVRGDGRSLASIRKLLMEDLSRRSGSCRWKICGASRSVDSVDTASDGC